MIREVKREELSACADLIRKSFQTVADEFGFTRENAPRFTAFATTEDRLAWHMDGEHRLMYLDEEDGRLRGYYSLLLRDKSECELGSLSVLPEYRRHGIGGRLLRHAMKTAAEHGCAVMNLSIVEENTVLRKWYERFGAVDLALLENGQYNTNWKYIHTTPEDLEKVILDLQAKQVFTVHHDKFALSVHPWYEPDSVAHNLAARHNIHLLDAPIGTVVSY